MERLSVNAGETDTTSLRFDKVYIASDSDNEEPDKEDESAQHTAMVSGTPVVMENKTLLQVCEGSARLVEHPNMPSDDFFRDRANAQTREWFHKSVEEIMQKKIKAKKAKWIAENSINGMTVSQTAEMPSDEFFRDHINAQTLEWFHKSSKEIMQKKVKAMKAAWIAENSDEGWTVNQTAEMPSDEFFRDRANAQTGEWFHKSSKEIMQKKIEQLRAAWLAENDNKGISVNQIILPGMQNSAS